jgi:hypothetical protein
VNRDDFSDKGRPLAGAKPPDAGCRRKTGASRGIAAALALSVLAVLLFASSAQAATASWSFSPSSFDFGTRLAEEGRSEPKGLVLTNTGEVPLEPALVTLVSAEESDFGFYNHCKSALAPGGSCEVDVTFRATAAGPRTATLEVSERNSLVAPAVASLSGAGGEPSVEIDPSAVDFGTITLPFGAALTHGSSRVVTVANVGSADLIIHGDTFGEGGMSPLRPNFFGNKPSFGSGGCFQGPLATVPPGGSRVIQYEFEPRDPGTYQAQIQLLDNAPDSPQTIALSGTAAAEAQPPLLRDTEPPASPVLTHKPARRSRHRVATFAFSPGDPTTTRFQCSLGGGPLVSTCRSPVRYRSLKPGRHLFRVRAVGGDGVPGPVVSYRWRILH